MKIRRRRTENLSTSFVPKNETMSLPAYTRDLRHFPKDKAHKRTLGLVPTKNHSKNSVHEVGVLVLLRHGQSQWNFENRFTGWVDVPLTERGKDEAGEAAKRLLGMTFDVAFTSNLSRAQDTLRIILEQLGQVNIPIHATAALNERHYGSLQGLNKAETEKKFGAHQVMAWRRSYRERPPGGESLEDTGRRVLPHLEKQILAAIRDGKNAIVVAHGNSLRSAVMRLDELTEKQVENLTIETGVPIVYTFDEDMRVVKKVILEGRDRTAKTKVA